jgi:hypothetical protein
VGHGGCLWPARPDWFFGPGQPGCADNHHLDHLDYLVNYRIPGGSWVIHKQSGVGRENHKMMLDHYQQTKNLLVSYSPHALGFF